MEYANRNSVRDTICRDGWLLNFWNRIFVMDSHVWCRTTGRGWDVTGDSWHSVSHWLLSQCECQSHWLVTAYWQWLTVSVSESSHWVTEYEVTQWVSLPHHRLTPPPTSDPRTYFMIISWLDQLMGWTGDPQHKRDRNRTFNLATQWLSQYWVHNSPTIPFHAFGFPLLVLLGLTLMSPCLSSTHDVSWGLLNSHLSNQNPQK